MNLPTKSDIEEIFAMAEKTCLENNIGIGWIKHSQYVANISKILAHHLSLDENSVYIFGLFHDIGRMFSKNINTSANHGLDGYRYMQNLGFPEVARYCITHEFLSKERLSKYDNILFKKNSIEDKEFILNFIQSIEYTDYDRIVQIADSLATKEGYVMLEQRVIDLMRRKGNFEYMFDSFKQYYNLKKYFDKKIGTSIYDIIPNFWDEVKAFNYADEL